MSNTLLTFELDGFIVHHLPVVKFGNNFNAITGVANHFHLDSCCPLEPNHHRMYRVYECNQVMLFIPGSTLEQETIHLTSFCFLVRKEFGVMDFDTFMQKVTTGQLRHGLVQSSLVSIF